jgi:tetratricopeptide (TPR) repeat protein
MTLGFYFGGRDRALVYIVFLVSAALPFLIFWAEGVYTASTPQMRAVVEANERGENALALAALPGRTSFEETFSYGLALKRAGRLEEASGAFLKAIAARKDARAYVNLAGCLALTGRKDKAIELYQESIQTIRPTAAAYFNLSQLQRAALNYAEGDKLFAEAAKLDPEKVARFEKQTEKSADLLVDETLSEKDFLRLFEEKEDSSPERPFDRNAAMAVSAASLLWMAFFFIYSRKNRLRAFRCSRCGKVLCPRCEQLPAWGRMCKSCYQSLVKLEVLDSKERVSRLLVIHGRQVRRNAVVRTLGFAPPGISYIYAENVLKGTLLLWVFLFFAIIPVLNPLFTTGLSGMKHGWLDGLSYMCAGLLYLGSYAGVKNSQRRGWL